MTCVTQYGTKQCIISFLKHGRQFLCRNYFNRDLTPAEVEQAFLVRKERRESRQRTVNSARVGSVPNSADEGPVLNPSAQPFPTTSE